MKDLDIVHFYPSEEIFDKAVDIFEEEKKFLGSIIPNADIQHVGSCAIPGAIGKFDVDIQIRLKHEDFSEAVRILREHYPAKHEEKLWNENLAIFKSKDSAQYDIDYVVTVIGSKSDDYYRVRDFLIANPEKLKEYNEMKMKYEGKPYHEYRTAKAEFLGGNGTVRFLDY
jgi:GrpB-like predicted nucleotidyltransferase (UPF0157 family)